MASRHDVTLNPDGTLDVTGNCPFCKEGWMLGNLPTESYRAWKEGEYVQAAFPQLTAAQRELLISGTCTPCWDKHMAEEEY